MESVLGKHRDYHDVLALRDGGFFVNIRTNWFMLETPTRVSIRAGDGHVEVHAETQSQAIIIGDIFGLYARYLRRFFARLSANLPPTEAA